MQEDYEWLHRLPTASSRSAGGWTRMTALAALLQQAWTWEQQQGATRSW